VQGKAGAYAGGYEENGEWRMCRGAHRQRGRQNKPPARGVASPAGSPRARAPLLPPLAGEGPGLGVSTESWRSLKKSTNPILDDEIARPESLLRPGRRLAQTLPDDIGPGSGSKIFPAHRLAPIRPEFGPHPALPRRRNRGHRGGWKKGYGANSPMVEGWKHSPIRPVETSIFIHNERSAENSGKNSLSGSDFSTFWKHLSESHKGLWTTGYLQGNLLRGLLSIRNYGLNSALRRWRSTRKLWYPKDKIHYGTPTLAGSLRSNKGDSFLRTKRDGMFRRRLDLRRFFQMAVYCNLDPEGVRTAQKLGLVFGWNITICGFAGEPWAPTLFAERGASDVEVGKRKCLSA